MVSEYHPFRKVWQDSSRDLKIGFRYLDRVADEYYRSAEVPGAQAGSLTSYEFRWTVSDYLTAFVSAGCDLVAADEFRDELQGWENAPMAGLPNYLLLVGRKR
jgi:hypothetical protein